jgi:spore germination cell wall hydrolase CwlJ-like protein
MLGPISTYLVAVALMEGDPLKVSLNEYECMIEAIHFEAKGESTHGKVAVANVILNRVDSRRFPDTICEVVYQPKQFSYLNKGRPTLTLNGRIEKESFAETAAVALKAVNRSLRDITDGSDHYYAHHKVEPFWKDHADSLLKIGNHTFAKL